MEVEDQQEVNLKSNEENIKQEQEVQENNESLEEDVIMIGDEEVTPPQKEEAPQWVKDLRKQNREQAKKIKEYEAKLKSEPAQQVEVKKPTLEDCDYDEDRYRNELKNYIDNQNEIKNKQKKELDSWNNVLVDYSKKKNSLKVSDYEDAEYNVSNVLNKTQQAIILEGANNSANIIYALGKNEEKLKELAAITNPVQFAFAVANLQGQIKHIKRKPKTEPDEIVRGSKKVVSSNKELEKLKEEAYKTGDFTKYTRYKQELKKGK